MKKHLFLFIIPLLLIVSGCSKDSGTNTDVDGTKLNTWTFTEGSKVYSGPLLTDASLSRLFTVSPYTLGILGAEKTSGYMFNMNLSLLDSNFTVKHYQSGVVGSNYLNAFYYTESPASTEDIYKSSDLDPGPVMDYTITAYDAAKDIVTIEFSGKAQRADGSLVDITKGKVTAKVER